MKKVFQFFRELIDDENSINEKSFAGFMVLSVFFGVVGVVLAMMLLGKSIEGYEDTLVYIMGASLTFAGVAFGIAVGGKLIGNKKSPSDDGEAK